MSTTTTEATLSNIAREGGVAYDDMVRDGGGIGAIGPMDRERIVRYEDTFGARNWPLVKAMADVVAEAERLSRAPGVINDTKALDRALRRVREVRR